MMRGRPYPLWYRRLLLAVAALLDRRVQSIRANVKRHTPYRDLGASAAKGMGPRHRSRANAIERGAGAPGADRPMTATEVLARTCTCPAEERPPTCQRKYALTDCQRAYELRGQMARDQVNAL